MILINETLRPTIKEKPHKIYKIFAINSAIQTTKKCTWNCHNNTPYCRANHLVFIQPYLDKIDPFYFGIVNGLHSTGNYVFANIIFLVILWPLLMYFLSVKILDFQREINKLKKEHGSN